MNVFVVSRGYPSKTDPQWGNFETDQARALASAGHKVVMLSVDIRYSKSKKKLGITKEVEKEVVSYSLNPGPFVFLRYASKYIYRMLRQKLILRLYDRVIKAEGMPDIIYAHYQDNIEASLTIKKKYKVPVVGLEHWSALGLDNPPRGAIESGARIYPAIDKLLVVSDFLKKRLKHYCEVDSEVLNNIIGNEFRYKEYENTDGVVKFVLTGNLIPLKNFELPIKALKDVVKEHKNVLFTIVGDGPEKEKLHNIIEENNLTDNVKMVGRKDRNYIVQLLQNSDVYIMSSTSETFGVAAGEALACGVPVISTDCGGPRDFMNEFNGILIPVNDVDAMEKAILHMVEHYKEYDRKRIAQDCHERFSSEAIAKQLTQLFQQVVK